MLFGMRKGPWPTVNVTAGEAGRIFHPAFESATEALDIHRPPKSKSHRNEQEIHSNTWTTRELDLFGVTESLSTRDTSSFRNCRVLQAKEKKMEVRHACQIPHLPSAHPPQTPGVPSAAATPATFDLQSPKSNASFIDLVRSAFMAGLCIKWRWINSATLADI